MQLNNAIHIQKILPVTAQHMKSNAQKHNVEDEVHVCPTGVSF